MIRLLVVFGALSLSVVGASISGGPVARLQWMSGCWRYTVPARRIVIEEQWMQPSAGMMLGMGRTVRGDTAVVEYEHVHISEKNGRAVYHAEPSGQQPTDFTEIALTDTSVTFENAAHDFPQRVMYRRVGADSLFARVEGTSGGRSRGVDFLYGRVSCTKS